MKNAVVFIVFFMLVKPVIPFLEYVINYDYIVKELCENKEKPALKCNGKCHLAKQLAKASEEEKSGSSDKKQNGKQEIEIVFCVDIKEITFVNYETLIVKKIDSEYQNLYASTAIQSIFHPPTFLV